MGPEFATEILYSGVLSHRFSDGDGTPAEATEEKRSDPDAVGAPALKGVAMNDDSAVTNIERELSGKHYVVEHRRPACRQDLPVELKPRPRTAAW